MSAWEDFTVEQLREIAKEYRLSGFWGLRKEALIRFLEKRIGPPTRTPSRLPPIRSMRDLEALTKVQLKAYALDHGLRVPKKGSGKEGSVLKTDLVERLAVQLGFTPRGILKKKTPSKAPLRRKRVGFVSQPEIREFPLLEPPRKPTPSRRFRRTRKKSLRELKTEEEREEMLARKKEKKMLRCEKVCEKYPFLRGITDYDTFTAMVEEEEEFGNIPRHHATRFYKCAEQGYYCM